MQIKSIYKGARISAFKCREVTRAIQGLPVAAALDLLAFTPKKAAGLIAKTLKSAVANAENINHLRAEKLVVQEATVGEGPRKRRTHSQADLPHPHHFDRRNHDHAEAQASEVRCQKEGAKDRLEEQ